MSPTPEAAPPVRLEPLDGGALWRVVLATPESNILDMDKSVRLAAIFDRAAGERGLKAIVLDADGPNFSYGASIPQHLPQTFEAMLRAFHRVFDRILEAGVVTLTAVRGHCLGGGLELAAFSNRVFAAPDARLGQPEIALGVLAPVGSVVLAERIGRSRAEDLCLSGRAIAADEALRIGLVDEVTADPAAAAVSYAREHLLPRSASSLRLANRAVRGAFAARFRRELSRVERLYVDELMSTSDAVEGLRAFLEKRKPSWTDS